MAHTFTGILIRAVFPTSGRMPLLTDAIRPDMHAYLSGILRQLRAVPIVIGGTADHVHLLARLPADLAVADCLRIVKANPRAGRRSGGSIGVGLHGKADTARSASANRAWQP